MHDSPFNLKTVLKAFIFSLSIIVLTVYLQINDSRTKIVFCDVGQGDAAYIRIKNQFDVLIDAGPDRKVLSCLGKYMPFWDRKIELAFLTHHDKDHYGGFFNIIERYRIGRFLTVNYRFDNKTYQRLRSKIEEKQIPYQNVFADDKIMTLNDIFFLYWPPQDFKSYQSNDFSLIFLFQEGGFRTLFTGDASPYILSQIVSSFRGDRRDPPHNLITNIDILKIPHHGSKNGLTKKFLELANPRVAVISVGKNNSYGHPAKVVLDMLKAKNVKIRRTDVEGDIVFKLKSQKAKVKN